MAAKHTKTVLNCLIPAFLIGVLVLCAPEPKETSDIEIPQQKALENVITPEFVAVIPTPTPTKAAVLATFFTTFFLFL